MLSRCCIFAPAYIYYTWDSLDYLSYVVLLGWGNGLKLKVRVQLMVLWCIEKYTTSIYNSESKVAKDTFHML